MTGVIIYGKSNWTCPVVLYQRSLEIGGEEPEGTYFPPRYMWYALRGP